MKLSFKPSLIVKLNATAIGAFSHDNVTPLNIPGQPSVVYKSRNARSTDWFDTISPPLVLEDMVMFVPGIFRVLLESMGLPCTCMRRRMTCNGYVAVCAINPATPPHTNRWMVVSAGSERIPSVFSSMAKRGEFLANALSDSKVAKEIPA